MSVSYANIIQLFMTTKETSTKKNSVESSGKCKISKSFGRTQFSVLKNLIFFSVSH